MLNTLIILCFLVWGLPICVAGVLSVPALVSRHYRAWARKHLLGDREPV